jgi:hypothetical protein
MRERMSERLRLPLKAFTFIVERRLPIDAPIIIGMLLAAAARPAAPGRTIATAPLEAARSFGVQDTACCAAVVDMHLQCQQSHRT